MGKLLDMIPAPYRWLAWLVLAAVIYGSGAWSGRKATATYYQPKLAAQTARAAEFESAYGHLSRSVARQNAAINDLLKNGVRRQAEADQAVARARADSRRYRDRVPVIAGFRSSGDGCRDAQRAVDDELRWERGKS